VARPQQPPLPSDPAQLEREIEERRERLAATVDELAYRVQPKVVARRSVAGAQAKVRHATTTDDGTLRVERVAAVAGAVLLLVVLAVVRRRRR